MQHDETACPKRLVGVVFALLALAVSLIAYQTPVHASGNPPTNVIPAPKGGVNTLHGGDTGLEPGVTRIKMTRRAANGTIETNSAVTGTTPIIMVHGFNMNSAL